MTTLNFINILARSKPLAAVQATRRLTMTGSMVAALAIALLGANAAWARDVMEITLHKTSVLQFEVPMNSIIIGKGEIADVAMESPQLLLVTGKSVGETNLIVLDKQGRQIASFDLIVAPETDRHVTIHRAANIVATYSCLPRCTVLKNP